MIEMEYADGGYINSFHISSIHSGSFYNSYQHLQQFMQAASTFSKKLAMKCKYACGCMFTVCVCVCCPIKGIISYSYVLSIVSTSWCAMWQVTQLHICVCMCQCGFLYICFCRTLAQFLSQQDQCNGADREREVLCIFQQIVAAIQYIHQHNILHR